MLEILREEPLTCWYPVFVLLMLLWALWSRPSPPLKHAIPDSAVTERWHTSYAIGGSALLPHRFGLRPHIATPLSPFLDRLHATTAADYAVLFEKTNCRIQLR